MLLLIIVFVDRCACQEIIFDLGLLAILRFTISSMTLSDIGNVVDIAAIVQERLKLDPRAVPLPGVDVPGGPTGLGGHLARETPAEAATASG